MIKFIRDQKKLEGKTVLLRADLDAPHEKGKILDDFRIRMSAPTIEFLLKEGAKVIVVSKIGRPKKAFDPDETLRPAAHRLAEILKLKMVQTDSQMPDYSIRHLVFFTSDIRDAQNRKYVTDAPVKDLIVLENIRFYDEEAACDHKFAKELASMADIYVNDAFAMAHRNEASVSLIPQYLPAYAGLNMEKELNALDKILHMHTHPFLVMIGGAKITDKVGAVKNLGKKADQILVGGGPANLFYLAKGYEIGKSMCEKDELPVAHELLRNFKDKIVLPKDFIVADHKDIDKVRIADADDIKKNEAIYDIGPKSILDFASHIKQAKKMVWNGPMGWFEQKKFSHGTMAIAELFASKSSGQAFGLVGGGDTLEAVSKAQVASQIDFISTGGSATLDYLSGDELPAIKALNHH